MTSLSFLPAPKASSSLPSSSPSTPRSVERALSVRKSVPPYGQRQNYKPRTQEDYGDGGAFPEVHIAQYPLEMGRSASSYSTSKTVPLTLDSHGKIKFETILAPGKNNMQIQARHEDTVAKRFEDDEMKRPDAEVEQETTLKTKQALEKLVNGRISAAQPGGASGGKGNEPTFIKYTPANQPSNGVMQPRIIRMTETALDPLEPSKFQYKKAPRGPPSPPVPVMHSPPRKVTAKEQQEWKIPPCISNWKNNKGYTISLDKRLAADGRGLQEVVVNDNFAKISEALYIAERTAREEVARRAEIEKRISIKEKEKKEEMLRRLAQEARMERVTSSVVDDEDHGLDDEEERERDERDRIRNERRRERERDLRMQRNRSAAARNAERDVGERIALGQAVPAPSTETMYDQRLFNQTSGMDSGFGDEDAYSVYSKPLFHASSANALYRPKKAEEEFGGEEDMKKLLDTSKFKPDKGFSGTEKGAPGSGPSARGNDPVQFEKEEADPFGLDEFLSQAKSSTGGSRQPRALDKIGTSGHMHAGAGNADTAAMAESGGSKRNRIAFEGSRDDGGSKRSSSRR